MASKYTIVTAAIICASLFWYGEGQIPIACTETISYTTGFYGFRKTHYIQVPMSSRKCCPNMCGAPRGQCVGVRLDSATTDPRNNWPHFFDAVCECNDNYGGYDCKECKFGYTGQNCDQRHMRRRRSITSFTAEEREEYIDALKLAKRRNSDRYMAINEIKVADQPTHITSTVVAVPLYDLFVWVHFYVGRYNGVPNGRDYAHESGGFPTWHRLFLLWFEREMQHLTGNEDFSLPYWDWSEENNREFLFSDEWLGSRSEGGKVGGVFENWRTVCWQGKNKRDNEDPGACNLAQPTSPLYRCLSETHCNKTYKGWPDQREVKRALSMTPYDSSPFSKWSTNSFRNFLEGFEVVNDCELEDPVLCSDGIHRRLHNSIHLILSGTMGNVAASANDPIFLNHHTMIDYIFEKWLQKNSKVPYAPDDFTSEEEKGHRANDVIVPFIPLYTHEELFNLASEFGYEYEESETEKSSTGLSVQEIAGIASGAVAVVLVIVVVIIIYSCKKRQGITYTLF